MSTRISRVMVVVFLVLLSLQSISFAATSNMRKKIPVTYRGIQVVVEGKVIAGEEPFIMDDNGIMMVPVRMVAEAGEVRDLGWIEKHYLYRDCSLY